MIHFLSFAWLSKSHATNTDVLVSVNKNLSIRLIKLFLDAFQLIPKEQRGLKLLKTSI